MVMQSLEVEVHATLTVPDETVERCLRLIEMWLNDNPHKRISGGVRGTDGKILPFKIETMETLNSKVKED